MKKFILLALTAFLFNSAAAYAAGAIAVDDEEGISASEVGYGIGQGATREAAAADALAQCKSSGNSSCKVAVKYDTCGAYAASKGYSGIGWGKTEAIAKKAALEECGSGCKIVVSDCDK